jgi:hypothetical protein
VGDLDIDEMERTLREHFYPTSADAVLTLIARVRAAESRVAELETRDPGFYGRAAARMGKRLAGIEQAAQPHLIEAVRNCVNFYVTTWYERKDGTAAKLDQDGPVARLLDALAELARSKP